MILSLVSMTLLLLRNNHILFHQSSNFVLSLSNHSGSGTMLLGIIACLFMFIVIGTSATDIASSDCSVISSKVLFVICKDPSCSDSTSMLSILLKLVLVSLYGLYHTCFVYCPVVTLPNFVCGLSTIYLSCKVSSVILYQML